jgi:hypothetical protein
MVKKKSKRNEHQKKVLKLHKMSPLFWAVVVDTETYMVVKHRITGKFQFIDK